MLDLIKKNSSLIKYGIFGVLTTIINFCSYGLFYKILHISNILSNILAWILAVVFAYITNKIWVFESKSLKIEIVIPEIWKFTSCRILTGIMDLIIMYIAVDILKAPSMIIKFCSNILVIIINYVASKLFIFK